MARDHDVELWLIISSEGDPERFLGSYRDIFSLLKLPAVNCTLLELRATTVHEDYTYCVSL